MITRISLVLDGLPGSRQAENLALGLAKAAGATLEAAVLIDTPWIDRPQAVGIGGSAYKMEAEAHVLKDARARAGRLRTELARLAAEAGVSHEFRVAEGDPAAVVLAGSVSADLIVIARDATFWGEPGDLVSPAARAVLRLGTRPVLLAPAQPAAGEAILVAFDGSAAASRALHMLALLGLGRGRQVHVVSIATAAEVAAGRANAAAALLRAHGAADVHAHGIGSDADPSGIILQQAQEHGAGMVVMGAFGHQGLRELLFGSCTQRLLRNSPVALLVHH
jgi:nucleotide-binding universal stress UspA family protein